MLCCSFVVCFFFKQKTAYEMRISDWSSDVCSSDLAALPRRRGLGAGSAMLRHGLDQARELGLPVYLEASTPQNQRLYSRHGFQEHGAPIRQIGRASCRERVCQYV